MNKSQMAMLSVKSAIERTVQGYLASYAASKQNQQTDLYNDICRYMAGLFASRQIDRDYVVGVRNRSLEVSFTVAGNKSHLSFMVPSTILPKPSVVLESNTKALEDFIKGQEPLGDDFKKVLDDNRWDLYSDADE